MSKIRYIAIMAMVIIFATTAIFVGCKKEENQVVNKVEKVQKTMDGEDIFEDMEYWQLDEISKGISEFHDYTIKRTLVQQLSAELNGENYTIDMDNVFNFMQAEISNFSFGEISGSELELSYNPDWNYEMDINTFCNEYLSSIGMENIVEEKFNLPIIQESIELINGMLSGAMTQSSLESFDNTYHANVDGYLQQLNQDGRITKADYFCLRVYSDVLFGSSTLWIGHIVNQYAEEIGVDFNPDDYIPEERYEKGFLQNAWNKVSAKAQEVWNKVEPYAKADATGAVIGAAAGAASGAVIGAATGALAGGVGALPGAVAGAAEEAVRGAISGGVASSLTVAILK